MAREMVNRIPIIGFVLVLLGVTLLLNQMDVIDIGGWSLIWIGLALFGGATVIRSFMYNERQRIFFGTFCFLAGILFFLKKAGFIYGNVAIYFPAFLLIFGFSFFMLFVFNMKDWHLLIPAFIFLGLGAAMMMTALGLWYSADVWRAIHSYWPLILILLGVVMLIRRRKAT